MELKEDIKELSEIFDSDSNDSFITLYINKKNYEKFLNKRIKAITNVSLINLIFLA